MSYMSGWVRFSRRGAHADIESSASQLMGGVPSCSAALACTSEGFEFALRLVYKHTPHTYLRLLLGLGGLMK